MTKRYIITLVPLCLALTIPATSVAQEQKVDPEGLVERIEKLEQEILDL